ncbi:MAG: glycosyltransferase [Acidobacteriia bacterium]|nr:glycosyltransferase [Terriglobia bacterium]
MRIVLNSVGSTGDVMPFLALGQELKELGHSVILAAPPNFQPMAEGTGIDFAPVGPFWENEWASQLSMKMVNEPDPTRQWSIFFEGFSFAVPAMFRDLSNVCEEADVLVASCYSFAAHMVQETLGIPFITVRLAHFGEEDQATKEQAGEAINRCRCQLGFQALDDPFGEDSHSRFMALYAISPALTGFSPHQAPGFFFCKDTPFSPSRPLAEFLAAGEKPIIMTFGSMVPKDPAATTKLLIAALESAGKRTIIQRGWRSLGLDAKSLPPFIKMIGHAPHGWLFNQASLIIHHGGVGTTAACLRAGVPSIVVPWMIDQPAWGALTMQHGTTSAVIPQRELSVERLSTAICHTFDLYERYQERAQTVAAIIQSEDGAKSAAQRIGDCRQLSSYGHSGPELDGLDQHSLISK